MAAPLTKSAPAVTTGPLEDERRRIVARMKTAPLEAISQLVTADIAKALGAASVRLYFKDVFTGEFYSRWFEGMRVREARVQVDPSSVVGYAAMTRGKAFAWKRDSAGERRYAVAFPLIGGGDVLGVLELIHGAPNATPDETRLKVFYDIAAHLSKRLQTILKVTVHTTPYDHLLNGGLLSRGDLQKARDMAQQTGHSVEHILMNGFGVSKEDLGRSLAAHFQCGFVGDVGALDISSELVARFAPGYLRAHAVLPVAREGDTVRAVVVNPRNLTLIDDIGRLVGVEDVSVSVAVREDILKLVEKLLVPAPPPTKAEEPEAAPPPPPPAEEEPEWEPVLQQEEEAFKLVAGDREVVDSAAIRLVNETIQAAIDGGASDVHFEPTGSGGMVIRFRVDGVLHDYKAVNVRCARPVVSRVKIMSKLDIAEHRLPQDGKIRLLDRGGGKVDLRVAIVPTQAGYEDIVLRLLPETKALKLEQLGMEDDQLARFRRVVEQPHGIIDRKSVV
jgi:hypothetical protein